MKPRGNIIPSVMCRSTLLKAISSTKKRKRLVLVNHYGASSKQASSNMGSSKLNVFNGLKNITDNLMPNIWKSAAVVSSLFSNLKLNLSKSSTKGFEGNRKIGSSSTNNEGDQNKITVDIAPLDNSLKSSELVTTDQNTVKKVEANREMEQNFFEWLTGGDLRKEFLGKDEKKVEQVKKPRISKTSLEQRSRFLVTSLSEATSSASQLSRLEEVCKHLILYPDQKSVMCKAGLGRVALRLRYKQNDESVQAQARCALALVGFHNPPNGAGIRILSIDGGGTRGMLAIEILRQLEAKTNKKVYQLFDFFCGVSSGAILGLLLGGLRLSLDECESLYRRLSDEIFSQSTFWGTSRLMWSHAYYDTTMWVNVLKKTFGEKLIIDAVKEPCSPKLAAVSAIMNLPHLHPFVFRNYEFPPGVQSYYRGSCRYKMWEAIRCSGAAPGYFEEYCLDDYLHQDGGVMINNPTALAIHEARLLWPNDHIHCVVSLGSGRYIPAVSPNFKSTNLKTKVLKIIDSATDTEAVHVALNDLLSPSTYFRMNPYLTEFHTLDENRTEKLDQMKSDAQMYLRRNEYKFTNVAERLTSPRSHYKRMKDWIRVQKRMYL